MLGCSHSSTPVAKWEESDSAEITAKEAVVIAFDDVIDFIPEPMLRRVSSTDSDDSSAISSGFDGKRRAWYVDILNKEGTKWANYSIINNKVVDIHCDDAANYDGSIYFEKGKYITSDVIIDSDEAVEIAIKKKGLLPGNPDKPENWLNGYHFNIGDAFEPPDFNNKRLVIIVSGISPNNNLANVTIDPKTGEVLGAAEQTGYDEDGHSVWEEF